MHKVAENLYRRESSGGYYALVKRTGKQFRRSLKTKDRKLAERRLGDLKGKIGALRISDDAELNFEQLAKYWNGATKHTIASGTLARRNSCIKNLAKFFKGRRSWMSLWKESPLRNSAKSRPKYPVKSKKSGKSECWHLTRLQVENKASRSEATSGTAALLRRPPGP